MKRPMPEWTIYKDDRAIGQAKTWHGALDALCKAEGLTSFKIEKFEGVVLLMANVVEPGKTSRYKINKTQ